ncbi:MAG: DUF4331 family protein [Acidobacteriia bacterium]|nr:DUF4331 family protein [Terriglobia bacterium]
MLNRIFVGLLTLQLGVLAPLFAADHRDAPTVNEDPAGDLGDVYTFLDPNNPSRLVIALTVFPFAVPGSAGYSFGRDILYQAKIDNNGDAREDFVVQFLCSGAGAGQTCRVWGPVRQPAALAGARNQVITNPPAISGPINTVFGEENGVQVFAGLRDDPFVADVSQLLRIIGTGTQDTFREVEIAPLGVTLRGRRLNAQGRSGFDTFGGFNILTLAVSFPKDLVRGSSSSRLGIWGTCSRQDRSESATLPLGERTWVQFERMGQVVFNTVFVPGPNKDVFNALAPHQDVEFASRLVPDALTSDDTGGNTIAGRAAVLTALGVTRLPAGAPLLLPPTFQNTNKELLRAALLPDVMRIDLDLPPNDLAIGQFGLTNGRRPGDDTVDIFLQLARQLADVSFPEALGVPGSGARRPGSLDFPGDRRVFAVLQGTDFIQPDGELTDFTTSGNEKPLLNRFPFLAPAHPLPGEPDTVGFPAVPAKAPAVER